eukprot:1195070-Prorocentrum_minimum.AAC.4
MFNTYLRGRLKLDAGHAAEERRQLQQTSLARMGAAQHKQRAARLPQRAEHAQHVRARLREEQK